MPPFQKKFRKTQLKLWESPSSRAKRWTHQGRLQFREQTSLNLLTYLSGLYNLLLVLASSNMLLQSVLFRANVLQSLTPNVFRSDSTESFHLFLGLPRRRFPSGFLRSRFRGTRSSSIRCT